MGTARITFKAKPRDMQDVDGNLLYRYVEVPQFTRSHCDMSAFRCHPKYGAYANSDMFLGMLKRIRGEVLDRKAFLRLDQLPDNVTVIEKGFLATIAIEV